MRIFLYEFITGGGWSRHSSTAPPNSLLAEGSAMVRALAADLGSIPGVRLCVARDSRYADLQLPGCTVLDVDSSADEARLFSTHAASADWSLIVAPEFCDYLFDRCRLVEQGGGRLLGPGSKIVALAGDKQATADHLAAHQVPAPPGVALAPGEPLPSSFVYPAVLKPLDGAGSQGIRLVSSREAVSHNGPFPARLETFCPGVSASVAFLCGPNEVLPLSPCRQSIAADGSFAYRGGSLPLTPPLAQRALRLATKAVRTLDRPIGYLGVDLILGDDAGGADDVVIEINPRVTTSYVGLRESIVGNLAETMLAVAEGRQVELCWKPGSIQFEATGPFCRNLDQVGI